MFISGLSGCVFLIVPVFICEFCDETIRGMMTSSVLIFYGIGMLISYVLGGSLEYHIMNYSCLSLTVFGVFLLGFLKESPTHLMKKGLDKVKLTFYFKSIYFTMKSIKSIKMYIEIYIGIMKYTRENYR